MWCELRSLLLSPSKPSQPIVAVVCQLDKPPDPSGVAHRFREEIERLSREQTRTIGRAVANLGYMPPDESAAYDFRRAKILYLIEDLKQLEKPA
jgi:hypothetical protein